MKQRYFITASGTDCGKTWVTAGVAARLRACGAAVRALKPVQSGFDATAAASSDAGVLLAACGVGVTAAATAAIAPWRFAAPLSPDLAALAEGRRVDFAALIDFCRDAVAGDDERLLIEGVGGVMAPLDEQHTVRDWIAALDVPVVLVCGTCLGALSHALTALAALREVGVTPHCLVVNETAAASVSLADTIVSLRPHCGDIPLLATRRDDAAALANLTDVMFGEMV